MTNLDALGEALLPSGIRQYVSFKSAAVLVLLLVVMTALFRAFVRLPPEQVAMFAEQNKGVQSPAFLIGYSLFAAICFVCIYATRRFTPIYYLRVAFFAMALTGILILCVSVLLPLRS